MTVRFNFPALLLAAIVLQGCNGNGEQTPTSADMSPAAGSSPEYSRYIQPIFNRRCIACHGCIGSPCNLKLDSFRAAERGALGRNPYSVHFEPYLRTDMDVVQTTEQWRRRGFFPVLFRDGPAERNMERSPMFQMLTTGYRNNQPGFSREALMPSYQSRYDHACPSSPTALKEHLEEHPISGMPFGLPAISERDFDTIKAWIASGSPGPTDKERETAQQIGNLDAVRQWEAFFNSPDKRIQLVARYIFDHVFLAAIVLEESPDDFFRLVRSKTPPPRVAKDEEGREHIIHSPVDVIATPLPYDDPYRYAGIDRFYYRLQKITTPIVQKNHFVWRLTLQDIDHLKRLFLTADWDDHAELDPPWGIGNPFRIFQAIPAEARYRFMLENSELIISGITDGPVCLGQTATYAVKDHFWVFFLDPEFDVSVQDPRLGLKSWNVFMDRSMFGNDAYEAAYARALAKITPNGYSMEAIWNGDRKDPDAWITVLRHESNTSSMRGRQGGIPRTFWLMGYSGFERIYYDTVASFKYWEGDPKKLETLIFFNDLRQEFEDNFLLLLPKEKRDKIRHQWTQGIGAVGLFFMPFAGEDQPTRIQTGAQHPLLSLVDQIQNHLGRKVSGPVDRLNPWLKPDASLDDPIENYEAWVNAVATLTVTTHYKFPRFLPSVILLKLNHGDDSRVYSLIANRVYASQDTLVFQNGTALPDQDTMSVYKTLIGGFPNLFMELELEQAPQFLKELRDIQTLEDWTEFKYRYGILRNSARFWPMYDWFNEWNFSHRGIEAGYLDLSYYDLLDSVY
jgi:Fatty acid cis/trans isomerase (CTI)